MSCSHSQTQERSLIPAIVKNDFDYYCIIYKFLANMQQQHQIRLYSNPDTLVLLQMYTTDTSGTAIAIDYYTSTIDYYL